MPTFLNVGFSNVGNCHEFQECGNCQLSELIRNLQIYLPIAKAMIVAVQFHRILRILLIKKFGWNYHLNNGENLHDLLNFYFECKNLIKWNSYLHELFIYGCDCKNMNNFQRKFTSNVKSWLFCRVIFPIKFFIDKLTGILHCQSTDVNMLLDLEAQKL